MTCNLNQRVTRPLHLVTVL